MPVFTAEDGFLFEARRRRCDASRRVPTCGSSRLLHLDISILGRTHRFSGRCSSFSSIFLCFSFCSLDTRCFPFPRIARDVPARRLGATRWTSNDTSTVEPDRGFPFEREALERDERETAVGETRRPTDCVPEVVNRCDESTRVSGGKAQL